MTLNRVAPAILIVALTTPVLTASQAQERSPTQGLKETDKFVKAGEATSKSLMDARTQVQKTLDTYNSLVTQPSTDMKGDYKKLMKSMKSMNDEVADARTKIEAMQKTGDTYFSGRAATIKDIQDPALLAQAQQRLKANQEQFGTVLKSLRDAGARSSHSGNSSPIRSPTLAAISRLRRWRHSKPQAEKLNAQGGELFKHIDEGNATANKYFQSMRSET